MKLTLPALRTLFTRKAIIPRRSPRSFRSRLAATERLETRAMLAVDALSAWQNQAMPCDVNADGFVTPTDALRIINELTAGGARQLTSSQGPAITRFSFMAAGDSRPNYCDVNGDGNLTASDALVVINQITAAQNEQVRVRAQVTDLAGNPIDEVEPGQDFQIRGFVKDLRQPEGADRGVFSVYFDVNYDATKMAVDFVGRTIEYGDDYEGGHRSNAQITATSGLLDDIGALAGLSPVGSDELLVFIVPMTATARGTATVTLDPEDSNLLEVAVFGGAEVPDNEILFEGDQVVVGFPPAANPDTATVMEDAVAHTIDVLGNDVVDQKGKLPLEVVAVTQGAHGTVAFPAGGANVQYTPVANYFGPDTFTYTVEDDDGNRATATVTVNVTNVNDSPVGNDDSLVVNAGSDNNKLLVLANDTDPDGVSDTLKVNAVTATDKGGTAVVGPDGLSITYTPAAGFVGTETFSYSVIDPGGATELAKVTVMVRDDNPIAREDTFIGILEDSADNELNVLANDELGAGVQGVLLIVDVGPRSNGGAVTIADDDKSLVYTPAADFVGTETFTYRVVDGQGGEATGMVSVTVNNVNDAPVAADDTFTVIEDKTENVLDVLANDEDADADDTLKITAVGPGSEDGTFEIVDNGTRIEYTPAANFFGQEAFTYTITDVSGVADTATVIVTVTDVTETPVAGDDKLTVAEDSAATTINVLANDSDPDVGDTLTITATSKGSLDGTIKIADDKKSLSYTPDEDAFGEETFTYTINDGQGGTDTATVTVTITPAADPPTAVDDAFEVDQDSAENELDVLDNDSIAPDQGETLTITAFTAPSQGGDVKIVDGGLGLSYTPDDGFAGTETFTYTIDDGTGQTATATVTVTVDPLNMAPVAADDTFDVDEDAQSKTLAVLTNDTDADGDTLTISAVGARDKGGAVMIAGDGKSLTYTPAANFNGSETFTYTITDSKGGTDTAQVTIDIAAVNDPPPVAEDKFTIDEDSAKQTFDVLKNDLELPNPDGTESFIISAVDNTNAKGTIERSVDNRTLFYTPAPNFSGTDTFTYTVNDSVGLTTTATVTVTVDPINDDPVGVDDKFIVERTSLDNKLDVLLNDVDVEKGALTITGFEDVSNGGKVTIATDKKSLTYTPAAGFVGDETFTYSIEDPDGGADEEVKVTVTVRPPVPGSLSGFVYVDGDNDGVKDSTEQALAGVTIRLWGRDIFNAEVDLKTTTDSAGAYRFNGVLAGSYVIEEVQPVEYSDSKETVGTLGGAASLAAGHDQFFLTLAAGQNGTNYNFGERGLKPGFIGRPNFFVP